MIQVNLWEQVKRPVIGFESSPDTCQKCHSAIWHLWSRGGFTVRLDPEPLDFKTDLEAFIAKRHTFKLWRIGPYRFEVDYRTPNTIKNWDGSGVVLAAHICDPSNIRTALPDYWPGKTPKTYEATEEVPY